jgi:ABC-type phosphate transport system substrate-binding protein
MKILFFGILVTLTAQMAVYADSGVEELVFIVHASNPSSEISANDIRDYYFKKKRRWPSGESVRFIDRSLTSHIHDIFVRNILRKSNSDVELFWIGQKLYTGDSAPLRENSDASTVQFVSTFKGAIGYVSSNSVISDPNVKTIKVSLPKKEE